MIFNAEPEDGMGRSWLPFQHIKAGPGVVGRTAPLVIALMGVFGVAIYAVSGNPWFVISLAVLAAVLVGLFVWRAFNYAESNPNSLLEGGELIRYYELEQAAKNPSIIDAHAEPVANTSLPPALTDRSGDDA